MSIFRFLTRKQPAPKQPAVAQRIIEDIRRLSKQQEWESYKEVLDIFASRAMQALLACGDSDAEVHRHRGYIQGLIHSVQLAEQLVIGDDSERQRKQRSDAAEQLRAATAASGLYATGYWPGA